jgi:hypothetical protein
VCNFPGFTHRIVGGTYIMLTWLPTIQRQYGILLLISLTVAFPVALRATAQTINFPGGFAGSQGQFTLLGSAQLSGSAIQLTSATHQQAGAAWYATPVNVQSFTSSFTFQLTDAAADGFTFTIDGNSDSISGDTGGGLGYQGIPSSVAVKFDLYNNAGEGTDSTGLYTDGAAPSVPATDMTSSGVNLHSGDTMAVQIVYNGTTLAMTITDTVTNASFSTSWSINIPATVGADTAYVGFTGGTGGLTAIQKILSWSYSSSSGSSPSFSLPTPTFSIPAGTYNSTETVAISDTTSGATIYYTTDGTTPTTSSTQYTGAITVNSTGTLEAIAVLTGYTNSPVASATYTITSSSSGSTQPVINCPDFAASGPCGVGGLISDGGTAFQVVGTTNGSMPLLSGSQVNLMNANTVHAALSLNFQTQVNAQAFTSTFTFVPNGWNIAFVLNNSNNNPWGFNGALFSQGAGCEAGFFQGFSQAAPPNNVFALELDSYSPLTTSGSFSYSSAQIYTAGQSPCLPNLGGTDFTYTPI